jgi:hypothetical protein
MLDWAYCLLTNNESYSACLIRAGGLKTPIV